MQPTAANTIAIIVTFHPEGNFAERVGRISSQVRHTLIVDNGSNAAAVEAIRLLSKANPAMEAIFNSRNLGVATALNQGIRRATELGAEWVITFDQDSISSPRLLEALSEIYVSYPESDRIGVIGCNFRDSRTGRNSVAPFPGRAWHEVETVITSGSILPVRLIEGVGFFEDDLFIDFVDHEFCFRLQKHGYHVLQTSEPFLEHTLGAGSIVKVLGWDRIVLRNSGPLRRYFVARNVLLTARCYFWQHKMWYLRHLFGIFVLDPLVRFPLEGSGTFRKLAAVMLGVADAMRGKTGFPSYAFLLKR